MVSPRVVALCALGLLGCGGATVSSRVPDASVDPPGMLDASAVSDDRPALDAQRADLDATSAVDAPPEAAVDASRCDPSALGDADSVSDDGGAPPDAPQVVEVSANWQLHQCVRMSDGTARCRGHNHHGQLGRGTYSAWESLASGEVPGLTGVEQIVTHALDATCTRHRDGTVRCWGSNRYALLGTGHAEDETCQVAGGGPCRTRPTLVPGLTEVVHLAAASFSFCAVRRDGSVWCWGYGDPLLPGTSPTPVRAPLEDVVGLWPRYYGWVVRLRSGRYLTVRHFQGLEIPSDAAMDDGLPNGHLCFRLRDTSVRCLGANAYGEIGNGTSVYPGEVSIPSDPGLCGVREVVVGGYNTCALLADRRVMCWGDAYGTVERADARETCVGFNGPSRCQTRPSPVMGLDRVARIFPAVWGGCALRLDHSVWCWGSLGDRANPMTPMEVRW